MAQNTNLPGGCATGIVRAFGVMLLFSGIGNAMSGDVVPGVIVSIIGAVMLFGGMGRKKQKRRAASQTVQRSVSPEAMRKAREAVERRNTRPLVNTAAGSAQKTRQTCSNPEPHRHYEMPRQPVDNAARMIENRKALYEAGLLTREEYDAEVRKLRGR